MEYLKQALPKPADVICDARLGNTLHRMGISSGKFCTVRLVQADKIDPGIFYHAVLPYHGAFRKFGSRVICGLCCTTCN